MKVYPFSSIANAVFMFLQVEVKLNVIIALNVCTPDNRLLKKHAHFHYKITLNSLVSY